MTHGAAPAVPPFCPNSLCSHHQSPENWPWKQDGFHTRKCLPQRIQRYRCLHCGRSFSDQTFSTTYWLKRPELLVPIAWRLLACSAFRQIAREFGVAHATVGGQCARLGRHALLFQHKHRPHGPLTEALVIDGFESFEYSQYYPTHYHLAAGARTHFFYGYTDSELRRKGRMTAKQKRKRAELEAALGRPDPSSIELEMAELLRLVAADSKSPIILSDDHPAYPRAIRRAGLKSVHHEVTSSLEPRTTSNPLFTINLLDLLIRHSGANHKRETIAFSKRRQSGAERMALLQVWRNFIKKVSERNSDDSPAMLLGLKTHRLSMEEVLAERLFPSRERLPERWADYYWRRISTRALSQQRAHRCSYAA